MKLILLEEYAWAFVGKPYRFGADQGGGDDPIRGFDCSGLVCELLRAAGVVPYNFRVNAKALHSQFTKSGLVEGSARFGDLAFFGHGDAVSHVGFCLDTDTMMEAGGGDASTSNDEVASHQNAFVRLRPIHFRKDFLCLARPNY